MIKRMAFTLVLAANAIVLSGCGTAPNLNSYKSVTDIKNPACQPTNTPQDACAFIRTWRFISSDKLMAYAFFHNSADRDAELDIEIRFQDGKVGHIKGTAFRWQDVPLFADAADGGWTYRVISARFKQ